MKKILIISIIATSLGAQLTPEKRSPEIATKINGFWSGFGLGIARGAAHRIIETTAREIAGQPWYTQDNESGGLSRAGIFDTDSSDCLATLGYLATFWVAPEIKDTSKTETVLGWALGQTLAEGITYDIHTKTFGFTLRLNVLYLAALASICSDLFLKNEPYVIKLKAEKNLYRQTLKEEITYHPSLTPLLKDLSRWGSPASRLRTHDNYYKYFKTKSSRFLRNRFMRNKLYAIYLPTKPLLQMQTDNFYTLHKIKKVPLFTRKNI